MDQTIPAYISAFSSAIHSVVSCCLTKLANSTGELSLPLWPVSKDEQKERPCREIKENSNSFVSQSMFLSA